MTALVLQARLESSRLPGKSLLPLGGRPMVFCVMEALSSCPWEKKILACPVDCIGPFAPLAEEAGFALLPGPSDDVLARYCIAVRSSGADRIVRATADNPFVFTDAAIAINAEAERAGADYAAYRGLPYGAGVESVASEALLQAEREALDPAEREHVCPYLYNHPELFKIHRLLAPVIWMSPGLKITVDTAEDYERAQLLHEALLSLPPGERNLGENIIAACKNIFTKT
jgi:spore coat polysaccharide biosynthesis protein SpsF